MANWKKVDADQLDADMTTVANAIRNRAGTTEQMEFPDGFVAEIKSLDSKEDVALIIQRQANEIVNDKVTFAPEQFQMANTNLTRVDLPALTTLSNTAFYQCSNLQTVNLPALVECGAACFRECTNLTELYLPNLETITGWGYDFMSCQYLTKAHFPKLTNLNSGAFSGCWSLTALILGSNTICTMADTSALGNSPFGLGTGYIYVPRSMVDTYKSATNWAVFGDRIKAKEDYPDITGG